MAHYYALAGGLDASGSGTAGDPYRGDSGLQLAVSDGSGGDTVWISGTFNISTGLDFSTTFTTTADSPATLRGWNGVDAVTPGVGTIDCGNNAITPIAEANDVLYTILIDIHFLDWSEAQWLTASNWHVYRCRFSEMGASGVRFGASARVMGCVFDTAPSGATYLLEGHVDGFYAYNLLRDNNDNVGTSCFRSTSNTCSFVRNVVSQSNAADAVFINAEHNVIDGNTIVSKAVAGTSKSGIKFGTSGEHNILINNIISGFDGTGGIGVDDLAGSSLTLVGHQHFFSNTTDMTAGASLPGLDLTGSDIDSDPEFTDEANEDYSVGTNAKEQAWPKGFFDGHGMDSPGSATKVTPTFVDSGAAQREEAAGGSRNVIIGG